MISMEFDDQYAAEQLRRSRHPLRRVVKRFYLRNILRDVRGPTIDFGCGAGQLLARLPPGSVGMEVNPYLIKSLRKSGLSVRQALGCQRDFTLEAFEPGGFRTLVIAHVLEHLEDPVAALRLLFSSCRRLGIERVIAVVPGHKGFSSDATHRTFIDRNFLYDEVPQGLDGFWCSSASFFPLPWEWVGRHYVFHEMKVVFDRSDAW